jgi:hypothetical protein
MLRRPGRWRKETMIINCYYYAPHNHTLLSEHLESDLTRIAELGTDAVSVCVQESQLTNWHQQRLRNVVKRIHAHGMKAHAVPNRWAGLVAGWLDGFGRFTLENPETLVQSEAGVPRARGEMVSCINNPKVTEHIRASLAALFERFEFDGLIWDEPHSLRCYCEYCKKLCEAPDENWHHGRFAAFIDEMSLYAKTLREGLVVSLFSQPHQDALFNALLKNDNLDYLGSDGHVRSADHQMHRMKGTAFEAHGKYAPLLKEAGKKSFFLLEAQRHRDEDLENYLANVDKAFALPMDHLMYYYSAHEMSPESEQRFNEATWTAVKQVHERRGQEEGTS